MFAIISAILGTLVLAGFTLLTIAGLLRGVTRFHKGAPCCRHCRHELPSDASAIRRCTECGGTLDSQTILCNGDVYRAKPAAWAQVPFVGAGGLLVAFCVYFFALAFSDAREARLGSAVLAACCFVVVAWPTASRITRRRSDTEFE